MATTSETGTETDEQTDETPGPRRQLQVAVLLGGVLTMVGIIAPVLGGAESELLGLFGRNYLHDAVHLASGVAGLVVGVAAGGMASGRYNRALGVVYLAVFALGTVALAAGLTGVTGLLNLNWADNGLHLLLGVVLAGVGYGVGSR